MVLRPPLYIDGISYWIPDLNKLRNTVAETLGVSMSSKYKTRMEDDIREYEKSIPATAKEVPASDTSIGRSRTSESETSSKHRSELKNNDSTDHTTSSSSTSKRPDSSRQLPAAGTTGSNTDAAVPTPNSTTGKTR